MRAVLFVVFCLVLFGGGAVVCCWEMKKEQREFGDAGENGDKWKIKKIWN